MPPGTRTGERAGSEATRALTGTERAAYQAEITQIDNRLPVLRNERRDLQNERQRLEAAGTPTGRIPQEGARPLLDMAQRIDEEIQNSLDAPIPVVTIDPAWITAEENDYVNPAYRRDLLTAYGGEINARRRARELLEAGRSVQQERVNINDVRQEVAALERAQEVFSYLDSLSYVNRALESCTAGGNINAAPNPAYAIPREHVDRVMQFERARINSLRNQTPPGIQPVDADRYLQMRELQLESLADRDAAGAAHTPVNPNTNPDYRNRANATGVAEDVSPAAATWFNNTRGTATPPRPDDLLTVAQVQALDRIAARNPIFGPGVGNVDINGNRLTDGSPGLGGLYNSADVRNILNDINEARRLYIDPATQLNVPGGPATYREMNNRLQAAVDAYDAIVSEAELSANPNRINELDTRINNLTQEEGQLTNRRTELSEAIAQNRPASETTTRPTLTEDEINLRLDEARRRHADAVRRGDDAEANRLLDEMLDLKLAQRELAGTSGTEGTTPRETREQALQRVRNELGQARRNYVDNPTAENRAAVERLQQQELDLLSGARPAEAGDAQPGGTTETAEVRAQRLNQERERIAQEERKKRWIKIAAFAVGGALGITAGALAGPGLLAALTIGSLGGRVLTGWAEKKAEEQLRQDNVAVQNAQTEEERTAARARYEQTLNRVNALGAVKTGISGFSYGLLLGKFVVKPVAAAVGDALDKGISINIGGPGGGVDVSSGEPLRNIGDGGVADARSAVGQGASDVGRSATGGAGGSGAFNAAQNVAQNVDSIASGGGIDAIIEGSDGIGRFNFDAFSQWGQAHGYMHGTAYADPIGGASGRGWEAIGQFLESGRFTEAAVNTKETGLAAHKIVVAFQNGAGSLPEAVGQLGADDIAGTVFEQVGG